MKMENKTLRLAFFGISGSGKDFTANRISKEFKCKNNCFGFADPLKKQLSLLLGFSKQEEKQFKYSEDFKENTYISLKTLRKIHNDPKNTNPSIKENTVTAEELFNCKNNFINNPSGKAKYPGNAEKWISLRELCVYFGTYIMQNYFNKKIWINSILNSKEFKYAEKENPFVIITDLRFPAEYNELKEQGFKFIRIYRHDKSERLDTNIAESFYDGFHPDYCFYNTSEACHRKDYDDNLDNLKEYIQKLLNNIK